MPAPERRCIGSLVVTTVMLWVGASAIIPLLPTYLHRHGTSAALVGVVMASNFACAVLTKYPVGPGAVLVAGLVAFAVGGVGFALQLGTWPALVYRSTQGIGVGAAGVASAAMIAQRVAPARRGRGFAFRYGSQSLALAIGPVPGGLLGASSMRIVFSMAAALAAIAALPVLLVREPAATTEFGEESPGMPTPARDPGSSSYRRARLGASAVFAAVGLLTGLCETCWSLLLATRHASALSIGFSWTLFCLPFALLSGKAGALADAQNRKAPVAMGILTSSLFAVIYPELRSVALLVLLGGVEAVGAVLVTPAALSMVSEWTPEFRHGAAQGTLGTVRTALTAVAAAGAGALFGVDRGLPFYATATGLALCVLFALRWWRGLDGVASNQMKPPASSLR